MSERVFDFNPGTFDELVAKNGSFILTTHINPDGDALGSEIGFAEWLLSLGKKVRVINHSHTPENYKFLDLERPLIEVYDRELHDKAILASDILFLLDTNDPQRSKSLESYFGKHRKTVLVDHHLYPKEFANYRFIDTEATSTGEMVYRLIRFVQKDLGGTISKKAAQALYVAIMTDTGSFRFPRTTAETFRITAELIDLGADPVLTYDRTYNSAKSSRLLLIARCLASLKFYHDNRLAIQLITQKDLADCGAIEEEVDGFVQFPLQVSTVEFSIFILELKNGWKISFRSKGDKSAAKLSQYFGGNGHFHAAGARIFETVSFDELQAKLIKMADIELITE
jgi:phosphoesterase RecJ-like protein